MVVVVRVQQAVVGHVVRYVRYVSRMAVICQCPSILLPLMATTTFFSTTKRRRGQIDVRL